MAYDETLANRVRETLAGQPGLTERKMFGGIAFMLNGNMCCGIIKDELMVRIGAVKHEAALAQSQVRPMDFTGRPMKGMVMVGAEGLHSDLALRGWVEQGVEYAASLPAK
ncbi:MAG: TfoX/Sxy family protein [Anaerolineae bacterium]|nr:TfoX/Sxy family protein [Anaerolineae bacterium]